MYGTTTLPADKNDPTSRTTVTKMLCMTSNPEEKRKIIGDIFIEAIVLILNLFLIQF